MEAIADGVWVAIGYDLANTTLIRTAAGNVVVDPGMSPARSSVVRQALLDVSPGPTLALIYTHSHIDHVGGASVWMEEGTQVWATDALEPHFFGQYGRLLPSERRRGMRQFGHDVPDSALPCSALGRRPDIEAALTLGAVLPTHSFSGSEDLEFGGVKLSLVEAHGETHDQLFVWLPDLGVLLPGDNWYRAFPNLYTVRGTEPRPVDDWIGSLDRMRALQPEVLLPSHTSPVRGRDEVQRQLTVYRDGIQWLRDETIRGANAGRSIDQLASEIGLPPAIASEPALQPLYGELSWSVRAIYGNHIGWFDGRVDHLYPLAPVDHATRTIAAMGGNEVVRGLAESAADPQWALHLAGMLRVVGVPQPEIEAQAAERLAETKGNSNGRAYLLQSAFEARNGLSPLQEPVLDDRFTARIPIDHLMNQMPRRLKPDAVAGVHESVKLDLGPDAVWFLTVRNGVLEVRHGTPLPGTPQPAATLVGTEDAFRALALRRLPVMEAIGAFEVEGNPLALAKFFARLEQGI